MRVLMLLSNGFGPDPRVLKEAKTLVQAGHSVELICWDRMGVYARKDETMDRITVRRFSGSGNYGGGLRQVSGYFQFYSYVYRNLKPVYDIVHCHDVDTLPLGALVKRRLQIPLVCDLHETYSLQARGAIRIAARLAEGVCLPKADGVICVNAFQLGYYGLEDRMTLVLPNYPEASHFGEPSTRILSDAFTVGFIGSVRNSTSLMRLMEASRLVEGSRVFIAGAGVHHSVVAEKSKEFCNTVVQGSFAYRDLPALYSEVDCVFAVYDRPNRKRTGACPVKVWESLYLGKPVIVAKDTDAGDFVTHNGLGCAVDRTTSSIAAAIRKIRDGYYEYQRKALLVGHGFTWEQLAPHLLAFYSTVLR